MEQLRKSLIRWNIAPLLVVAFLCYLECLLVNDLITRGCEVDPLNYGALTVLIATIGGILYKVYAHMQKDRKVTEDELE
jgi:hypothetical protein